MTPCSRCTQPEFAAAMLYSHQGLVCLPCHLELTCDDQDARARDAWLSRMRGYAGILIVAILVPPAVWLAPTDTTIWWLLLLCVPALVFAVSVVADTLRSGTRLSEDGPTGTVLALAVLCTVLWNPVVWLAVDVVMPPGDLPCHCYENAQHI